MRVAHILVCYSTDPTRAIESIPHLPDSHWYVFFHSKDNDLEALVESLILPRGGNLFPFRVNRGLARSWNDGIHLAMEAGCDAILLLNDDLFFREGGYLEFLDTISAVRGISRNVSYVTPLGLETGSSSHAGQIIPQQFACCAISPECVQRIGYFDENFTPAYYEDVDYDRRAIMAGMTVHVHQQVIVEHERSATNRKMTAVEQEIASQEFEANRVYFYTKWGEKSDWGRPFNKEEFGLSISFEQRRLPYGRTWDKRRLTQYNLNRDR